MRYRILRFNFQLFLNLLKANEQLIYLTYPLPEDTKFVRAGYDFTGKLFIVIQSETFNELKEGEEIPFHDIFFSKKEY